MKTLDVAPISHLNANSAIMDVLKAFATLENHKIDIVSWAAFPYKPKVDFKIAYSIDCIFLQYAVCEKEIRISYQKTNEPVYEDSCVEFFISFKGKEYYNFEFNCIGTCLAAFGQNREDRSFLPSTAINMIKSYSSMSSKPSRDQKIITWELTLIIPIEVFSFHKPSTLKPNICYGNFYKCGDCLDKHYLSWNPISSPHPDFHLKEYFGIINFI
ncbi:MAG: carbohydrate-binding family 9-like protein [Flavisolibacter sp.]